MKKLVISLIFLLIFPFFALGTEKSLEVVYPEIGGIKINNTTSLNQYVKYIFILSLSISGFIIFGVLIYAGFLYFTSAENPTNISEAKKRIFSSLLGVLILFGAYIIFNTINPELLKLRANPPVKVGPVIDPGIYVCDKIEEVDKLKKLIDDYGNESIGTLERENILEEIARITNNKNCQLMKKSGPFGRTITKKNATFFSMPQITPVFSGSSYESGEIKYKVSSNEYGLILHEKDRAGGKCYLLDKNNVVVYFDIKPSDVDFDFPAKSFTIFKKNSEQVKDSVTLYSCLNYNDGTSCVIGKEITPVYRTYDTEGKEENEKIISSELSKNVRSVKIEPEGKVFVIFYGDETQGRYRNSEKCEIIKSNDNNLLDNNIGRCSLSTSVPTTGTIGPPPPSGICQFGTTRTHEAEVLQCQPCMIMMIIVKGTIL